MEKMASLDEILANLKEIKLELEASYCIQELAVFGSYRRGESRSDSDLDILVSFSEPPSLIEFIRLEQILADRLGVEVDLVMEDALKPRIGKRILKEAVRI